MKITLLVKFAFYGAIIALMPRGRPKKNTNSLPASVITKEQEIPENAQRIEINPHPKQMDLIKLFDDVECKEVIACCGRRFGKSFAVAVAASKFCLEHPKSPYYEAKGMPNPPPTSVGLVGPDYKQAKRVYDEICRLFPQVIKHRRDTDLKIVFTGGATVDVWSGENMSSIRGAGYDVAVLDEAVGLNLSALEANVLPTLLDRDGRLWSISTPRKGKKNWWNVRFLAAQQANNPNVKSFHATSFDNPLISRKALEYEISRMDSLTAREEYYAEILDSSSAWLDPSQIIPIDIKMVPRNCLFVIIIDSAWGRPEVIDSSTGRRKDATVIAVLAQDPLGNVYCVDGKWEKHMSPEDGFKYIDQFARAYGCKRLVKELVADDPFFSLWLAFARRQGTPPMGIVAPHRGKDWKYKAIRYWAGQVLERGKFFMVEGCEINQHLRDEMELYSEEASKGDRCADDCLVVMADILNKEVWQGQREGLIAIQSIAGKDIFGLRNPTNIEYSNWRPVGRYSILAR